MVDSVTWLLATGNAGKIKELRRLLAEYPVSVKGLSDYGLKGDAPETGETFIHNAKQKATYYKERVNVPVLADDSGLEIDALQGRPGVHSAYFGNLTTAEERNAYTLDLLKGVPPERRTARFRCMAVFFDGARWFQHDGTVEGWIAEAPRGDGGFGYDPLFLLAPEGPGLAEIDAVEKNKISHRGKAFRGLLADLAEAGVLPR
ncbi:RdgB/HAM1 family non-canonical purine NTP pyrophosphatase [Acanthopleuribacter pedis]|uniref:dITP/XTP pyrophosphatase n=1 Tax=Acanthopleuribacter pedis TaxID=442870 RepID=A0A8J7U2Z6_9BACT|nr:RdgB/HAM1 family non-canonical purine NTP pyrophosphatase [Acanthopleuribacter pedis]MBO1319097.1 RdgB/HAM1 family non-canonical purine NTP pyrophosphatase [Acanthopleuribacter pedis]